MGYQSDGLVPLCYSGEFRKTTKKENRYQGSGLKLKRQYTSRLRDASHLRDKEEPLL
jgi:hypothetical protein